MAQYLVLARKYRSATFDEVVGQEHVGETLKNAIKSGRIAHGFLFVGTRGVGKTTMARILAKALNCLSSDGPTPEPCGKCDACVSIARGDDMDVIEIDGASNRGIEDVRELRANAAYRPSRCRYRVYYIDEVHMLTKEAFNALLKTLEEPPEHVKFIFSTTEAEKVPATIVSRCQRFDFRDIPTRKIAEHLANICQAEKVQAEDGALFRIARAAAGSMRDGLSLLDQLLAAGEGQVKEDDVLRVLGAPADERTAAIVSAIAENNPAAALAGLNELLSAGLTLESGVEAIGDMFRNMMLLTACGGDTELVELPESTRKNLVELARRFTLPVLVQGVSLWQTTARGLRGLSNGRALVEAALVRLAAADKFVDAASLIERLERLSGATPPPRYSAPTAPPSYGGEKKKDLATPAAEAQIGGMGVSPMRRTAVPAVSATGETPVEHTDRMPVPQSTAGSFALTPPPPVSDPPLPAVVETLPFTPEFLRQKWSEVVSALARNRQGYLSGLLSPARVQSVEGDLLVLGYDRPQEPLLEQARRMDENITAALGAVFGRAVRCQYVATGEAGKAAPRPANGPPASLNLSTAERAQIAADPAVKAVLDLFDGSIADIRRATPPTAEEEKAN